MHESTPVFYHDVVLDVHDVRLDVLHDVGHDVTKKKFVCLLFF